MMSERYVLLKIFENNIWQRSCPVEITEGALISDTLIGNVCLQLSLVNTTDKRIIRVYVDVYCFDKDGNPLLDGAPVGIIYSDAHMERGIPFGLDLTANLRSGRVDSVKCYVTKVIYLDGNNWRDSECTPVELDYKPIDSMEAPLLDIFAELYNQSYYRDNYDLFKYIPEETSDHWLCTCGRANENELGGCARCGMNKNWLMSSLSPAALKKVYKDRVEAAAAQERAAQAAAAAAAAEQARRAQQAQAISQAQNVRPTKGYEPAVVEPIPTQNPQPAEAPSQSTVSGDTAAYKPIRASKNRDAQPLQPIKPRAKAEKVIPAPAPAPLEQPVVKEDVQTVEKPVDIPAAPAAEEMERTVELGHTKELYEEEAEKPAKKKFSFGFGKKKKDDDEDDDLLDDYDEIEPVDEDEDDEYDDDDDWDDDDWDDEDDGKFPVRPLIIGILGVLNVCGIAVIVLMLLGII
ncbi:MAG: hypothetical protein E7334_07795 [Clostridiales bacterium]|nr:hypothetical protein [Clostridiales bacterium]